jgi:hypothetical protein
MGSHRDKSLPCWKQGRIWPRSAQANGSRPRLDQFGLGDRFAARKECHFVTELNQFIGKPSNDSLGTTIELRGNTLCQRRDLGDAQGSFLRD